MKCELCNALNEAYRFICEDDLSFCVIAKCPLKPGHVMILPKRHVVKKEELTEKESRSLFLMISKLEKVIKKAYNEDPIMHINTGLHNSQLHFHIHLLPSKGALRALVSKYENIPERESIPDEESEKIKDYIKKLL